MCISSKKECVNPHLFMFLISLLHPNVCLQNSTEPKNRTLVCNRYGQPTPADCQPSEVHLKRPSHTDGIAKDTVSDN